MNVPLEGQRGKSDVFKARSLNRKQISHGISCVVSKPASADNTNYPWTTRYLTAIDPTLSLAIFGSKTGGDKIPNGAFLISKRTDSLVGSTSGIKPMDLARSCFVTAIKKKTLFVKNSRNMLAKQGNTAVRGLKGRSSWKGLRRFAKSLFRSG